MAETAGEVARQAPTEQQESSPGTPKRFAVGQTVCNEKNEKGKLCNGHLKQIRTEGESAKHLRGDDVLHRCQTCGALYMGPPFGHVRDPSKQQRYVERDLSAILRAAGGTLPAYDYPTPPWRGTPKSPAKTSKAAPTPTTPATPAPEGETPEQKKARLVAEHKAKLAAKAATPSVVPDDDAAGADSSPSADRHRPAAEAQAATGAASAAPLSPTAATASPAAGAETPSDLSTEASTELTPGAPRDERAEAAPSSTPAPPESAPPPAETAAPEAAPKPKRAAPSSGGKGLPPLAPHLAPPPGETPEQKRERLRLVVEEAKRKAGKL